jgi:Xaa-Pro aminopeptidase
MWPTSGEMTLWWRTIAREFPDVHLTSAREMLRSMRWKKSPSEVAALRANAKATVLAMKEGTSRVRPGIRQRDAEAAVVAACIAAGAQGPSFWPWMMSGPTAHFQPLVRAFYDYSQLDRVVRAGETMRVDIGCAGHGYGADVGRTIPVSGKFTDGQRETWDLLASAYQAGMAVMKAGVTIDDVMRASRDEIAKLAPSLTTPQGKRAAQSLLAERGMGMWSIHGVGIESGETPPSRLLVDGAVIAFEPMFSAGDDAFYLEDMILITATGHEVLSDGLPYTAADIEKMVAGPKTPASP